MKSSIENLNERFEDFSLEEMLKKLRDYGFNRIKFSSSLGQEDQVITHVIFTNNLPIVIFTLDTGRLFEETYHLLDRTITRYAKPIEVYLPNEKVLRQFVTKHGPNSFYRSIENRKRCCQIRKTDVLEKVLKDADLWITGLRSDQSQTRQNLELFQWDSHLKITKFNPLLNWSLADVETYLKEHSIPQNDLHNKGYLSIGCAPCTKAIKPGEDIRAGRWWWENSKKECGLHLRG